MTEVTGIAGAAIAGGARKVDRRAMRIVLLSSHGGALEFYDFIIFGTFAAYISRAFFPVTDPTVSLLLTFATFGVGYVARPLGGFIFGLTGDTRGRRGSFMVSLGLMSLATAAMGLITPMPRAASRPRWPSWRCVASRDFASAASCPAPLPMRSRRCRRAAPRWPVVSSLPA